MAASFVSGVVDRVVQRYPRIEFRLLSAPIETVHRELNERNLDLLITRRDGPIADERLNFEFLFDDSFIIVAGAQHRLARRREIALAELVDELWVLPPPEYGLGSVIMDAFRFRGLESPRATIVTESPEVRVSLVATGRYLTIFPASLLTFPARRLELKILPVEMPLAHMPIGVVTLKNRTLSPVAKLFIVTAREVAKPMVRRKS
jgi:DNA-binding transcriptional LysR family regulator